MNCDDFAMTLFRRLRHAAEMLAALKRPALPLSTAQSRYDPMVQALADALAAEFGVTWTAEEEPQLVQFGRYRHYTTKVLIADQPLDAFPDWSSRYERVVESVAQVGVLGTWRYDPTMPRGGPGLNPGEVSAYQVDGDIELKPLSVEDLGSTRSTRDSAGGDIEMEIYEGRTRIDILAKVAATG